MIVTTGGAPVKPSPTSSTRAVIVEDPDGHFVELAQLDPTPASARTVPSWIVADVDFSGVPVLVHGGEAVRLAAHVERFIRSIKTECLDRAVSLGERHFRHFVREFVNHYREERNHQGIGNELIERPPGPRTGGPVRCRQRVGGILNCYYRSAA